MAKTILITGCSSGIGYDCAIFLRQKGWRVFASCRKEEDCARLREEGFEAPRIDYEDEASIEAGLAEVLEATGGTLDALFNNGAYAIPGAVEDLPRAALRQNLESNLLGYHDLTCRVIPVMRAQGHGRILQCSSVLGFAALRWRGSYNTTKFALEGLNDTLRLSLAGVLGEASFARLYRKRRDYAPYLRTLLTETEDQDRPKLTTWLAESVLQRKNMPRMRRALERVQKAAEASADASEAAE